MHDKVNELFKTDQEHIESITSAFIPPLQLFLYHKIQARS